MLWDHIILQGGYFNPSSFEWPKKRDIHTQPLIHRVREILALDGYSRYPQASYVNLASHTVHHPHYSQSALNMISENIVLVGFKIANIDRSKDQVASIVKRVEKTGFFDMDEMKSHYLLKESVSQIVSGIIQLGVLINNFRKIPLTDCLAVFKNVFKDLD